MIITKTYLITRLVISIALVLSLKSDLIPQCITAARAVSGAGLVEGRTGAPASLGIRGDIQTKYNHI